MTSENQQANPEKKLSRTDQAALDFAEATLSPAYRDALNTDFDGNVDVNGEDFDSTYDQHTSRVARAKRLMAVSALNGSVPGYGRERSLWDMRRKAAETVLNGEQLGDDFTDYFFGEGATDTAYQEPTHGSHETTPGERAIVSTNGVITSLRDVSEDPIDFFGDALGVIDKRKKMVMIGGKSNIGPENYATTLKYFADLAVEKGNGKAVLSAEETEIAKIHTFAALKGFLEISKKDKPNPVEMMNVLSAIRTLPPKIVGSEYTAGILKHSLDNIDQFTQPNIKVLFAAMTKLDMSACGEAAAMTIDVALRHGYEFERVSDMIVALGAVANLPAETSAGKHAFSTLLGKGSLVEQSSNLKELMMINDSLKRIVEDVSLDPKNAAQAEAIAEQGYDRALVVAQAQHNELRSQYARNGVNFDTDATAQREWAATMARLKRIESDKSVVAGKSYIYNNP